MTSYFVFAIIYKRGVVMKKSVYSLVLMEKVVDEIDKAAYKINTNRSNLINSILADYVSLVTPQDVNIKILKRVNSKLSNNANFVVQNTDNKNSFSVKSALDFKYNPIVKYTVELYDGVLQELGTVKVSVRTQNEELISNLNDFFNDFSNTENEYVDFGNVSIHCVDNGKFKRKFVMPNSEINEEQIGDAIALFIENLDLSLKNYFSLLHNVDEAKATVDKNYEKYLNRQKVII